MVAILIIGGALMSVKALNESKSVTEKSVRMLLLGASVGKAWELSKWHERMKVDLVRFETVDVYAFDKTEALKEIIIRPQRKFRLTRSYLKGFFFPLPKKPNILIIKECAAYFPGDLEMYEALISSWVLQCKNAGIKPVLSTVVPVTQEHDKSRPGRLKGILVYNDWIKKFSAENSILCLDFESVLRISEDNRSLNPEFSSGDGLHLNSRAYVLLDEYLRDQITLK